MPWLIARIVRASGLPYRVRLLSGSPEQHPGGRCHKGRHVHGQGDEHASVEPEVATTGKSIFAGPLAVCTQQDEPETQSRISRAESYEGRFGEMGHFREKRADRHGYSYGPERRPPPGQECALLGQVGAPGRIGEDGLAGTGARVSAFVPGRSWPGRNGRIARTRRCHWPAAGRGCPATFWCFKSTILPRARLTRRP